MPDKKDYQINYYQQRIGELSVQYEAALSDLRAEAAVQIDVLVAEIQRLKEKYEPVSEEDPGQDSGTDTRKSAKGND